jgi:hypothetical protein
MTIIQTKGISVLIILLIILSNFSCKTDKEQLKSESREMKLERKMDVENKMKKHLDAVTNRDLVTLKTTLHPDGKMQLILPGMEIINGVDEFMEFHSTWFSSNTEWSFETKILNSEVGKNYASVITELTYREPIRDGKPYFNRQIVSYVLENIKGQWYVIKDHCSSAEKSTD